MRKLVRVSKPVRWWRSSGSSGEAFGRSSGRRSIGSRSASVIGSASGRPGHSVPCERLSCAAVRGASPDYTDLWFLYQEVRRRRPETLLEFGSGCSTVILAFALHQNGAGHLWSLESDEHWAAATAAALPDDLRSRVTLVHAPVREDDRDVGGWSYTNRPDIDPDFVYLDGPALTRERKVAFDVLDLEANLQPGCVVIVDGRGENVRYLEARLRRRHSFLVLPPWRSVFEFE
jgi:Methyltransferase domain